MHRQFFFSNLQTRTLKNTIISETSRVMSINQSMPFPNVIADRSHEKLSRFEIFFGGRSFLFKILVPLIILCKAQTIMLIGLLQH